MTNPLLSTMLEDNFAVIEVARAYVKRPFQFDKAENMIKVAIGVRRCGKTIFLYQMINALLDQGISKEQILILNFEDDRLLPMTFKEMGKLLDAFYSLYPDNHTRRCHLFLDEVQNIEGWYHVVRRFFDTKNAQLYLTGSSSKLLSTEINTSLRGRSLAVEIWPFSFQEYLHINQIPPGATPFGKISQDRMQKHLVDYFLKGGFPAVQVLSGDERTKTLQGYIETIMLRDIIERHKITHVALLKHFIVSLIKNAATSFSIHKFHNDIKSQGYQIGKDTLYNYFKYIEDAFLIFGVSHYHESERIVQNTPKKIYAIDTGLIQAVSLGVNDLYGKLFENLVYLDLRRQRKKIYYYRTQENYEVDFITVDLSGNRECLQVCWDETSEKTLEREMRGLLAVERELGIKGRLITPREYLMQTL